MKILTLSDEVVPLIYSPRVRVLFSDVDLVVSCGDVPLSYLDFVSSQLCRPLYYVEGNHLRERGENNIRESQAHLGGTDLHRRLARYQSTLLAGMAGCLRYSPGPYQYTQFEMFLNVFKLVPGLLHNRARYGRSLDLFVTHAPPWGIHDQADLPHQGIKAFRWLDRVFQPALHVHGHVHYYRPDTITETLLGRTRVINAYRYRRVEL